MLFQVLKHSQLALFWMLITNDWQEDANSLPVREWIATYQDGVNRVIEVDSFGNIIVAGVYPPGDALIIKYDTNGNELWASIYNDPNSLNIQDIAVDNSDNIYILINSASHNPSKQRQLVLKYDSNGTQLWKAIYVEPISFMTKPESIITDSIGNIYVVGTTKERIGGSNRNTWTCILTKYDTNGNEIWIEKYAEPHLTETWGKGIGIDNDGNVYVTGGKT